MVFEDILISSLTGLITLEVFSYLSGLKIQCFNFFWGLKMTERRLDSQSLERDPIKLDFRFLSSI